MITMNTPETLNPEPSKSARMPRWMSILFGVVGFPLVHGVLPWGLSLLSTRHGWVDGWPGTWNLPGLILVVVGTAYAIWGLVLHSIEGWQWARTQMYLLRRGPYTLSRNPMYLGELVLWLGWGLFYGSGAVLIGFLLWFAMFNFVIVPQEERALEARFGEAYRAYKARVPRWLGFPRR
jgi:protein-S-isoprenylcysteine O-methyltransferase Ste14